MEDNNNNNNTGSDSDTNSVEDSQDYYEPISAVDLDTSNDDEIIGQVNGFGLSNGHCMISETEDGFSSISINGNTQEAAETEEEEEETPDDSEIRAVAEEEEEERRRRSAMMLDNAATVMEAMRAISFPGMAPAWATDVNEDRWIDQLRRLRSSSTTSNN